MVTHHLPNPLLGVLQELNASGPESKRQMGRGCPLLEVKGFNTTNADFFMSCPQCTSFSIGFRPNHFCQALLLTLGHKTKQDLKSTINYIKLCFRIKASRETKRKEHCSCEESLNRTIQDGLKGNYREL